MTEKVKGPWTESVLSTSPLEKSEKVLHTFSALPWKKYYKPMARRENCCFDIRRGKQPGHIVDEESLLLFLSLRREEDLS